MRIEPPRQQRQPRTPRAEIVTLERGRLVEDGTHDALIKTGGRYASLHRLQAGIHEVH
jgi:ABC-type transport system involved in cytochrome bd biosynthesis fused ATPase/permease subunit